MPDKNTDKSLLTKRDKQRIETRQRVFDTAIDEFNRVGLVKAQTDTIAKNAGVSIGTFYRYFPTKEAVINELLQQYMEVATQSIMERIQDKNLSLEETLQASIDPIFDLIENDDSPLIQEIITLLVNQPEKNLEFMGHPLLSSIIERFQEEKDKGATNYEPELVTRLFFTSVLGFISNMSSALHRKEAKDLITIFLKGIRSD